MADGISEKRASIADGAHQACRQTKPESYMMREVNGWEEDELDPLDLLEDDDRLGEFVEQIRDERIAKGLHPDTGSPDQPDGGQ